MPVEPQDLWSLGTAFPTRVGGIFPKFGRSAADKEDPGLSRIMRLLTALVMLLALAGVAGLGALGVMRARDDAIAREKAAARERARAIAQVVHDAVQSDLGAVIGTTARPDVQFGIAHKTYAKSIPYLLELLATHPWFASVGVYDGGGRLVVRFPTDPSIIGGRFGQQEYFKVARSVGVAHISNLFVQLGKPRGVVIAYSIRILYHGRIYGVFVGTTPITHFDAMVAPYVPAGAIVRIYNASGERISPSWEASGKTYTTDPVVGPTLAGRSSIRRTGGLIVAAEPIADIGWAVVMTQPAKIGDARVQDLTVRLSWLAGGATFLALIAATAAWRRRRPNQAPNEGPNEA